MLLKVALLTTYMLLKPSGGRPAIRLLRYRRWRSERMAHMRIENPRVGKTVLSAIPYQGVALKSSVKRPFSLAIGDLQMHHLYVITYK
jgi:hypothetical protein